MENVYFHLEIFCRYLIKEIKWKLIQESTQKAKANQILTIYSDTEKGKARLKVMWETLTACMIFIEIWLCKGPQYLLAKCLQLKENYNPIKAQSTYAGKCSFDL